MIGLSAIALLFLLLPYNALAVEVSNGAKIFNNNCAACHIGGGNILIAEKTLQKSALSQYLEGYSTDALTESCEAIASIIYQVQNGKGAMPAFKAKLKEQEILEVAAYVFQKAEQGW
jgi:cytochrome c6